jgi:hypothetical protein
MAADVGLVALIAHSDVIGRLDIHPSLALPMQCGSSHSSKIVHDIAPKLGA